MKKFITIYEVYDTFDELADIKLEEIKLIDIHKVEEVNFSSFICIDKDTKYYNVKLANDDYIKYYIHEDDVKELEKIEL